jgi:hypothetical protein
VEPSSVGFGSVAVGKMAMTNLTIGNTGNAALNVFGLSIAGADAGQFAIVAGGGTFSLDPGSTRTVTVRFAPTSLGRKSAVLRINSDDPDENPKDVPINGTAAPVVTIRASDPAATEAGPTTGAFTVTRAPARAPLALTVHYTVSGTATPGVDYENLTGSVIIPANRPSATIVVRPVNDGMIETAETVVVTLSLSDDYLVGSPSSAMVTIADNDRPTVTIRATDPSATEAGPTTGTLTVTRTAVTPSVPLTVFYTVAGTATPGQDYETLSGSVTIPQNANSARIVVNPIDDAVPEGRETVVVTLRPDSTYVVGAGRAATVTITSNE